MLVLLDKQQKTIKRNKTGESVSYQLQIGPVALNAGTIRSEYPE